MAGKLSIDERRQKMLAELKKLEEEERRERTSNLIKLGKQTELFLNGVIDFPVFINEAETITGWKFKGQLPRQVVHMQTPAVIPETVQ